MRRMGASLPAGLILPLLGLAGVIVVLEVHLVDRAVVALAATFFGASLTQLVSYLDRAKATEILRQLLEDQLADNLSILRSMQEGFSGSPAFGPNAQITVPSRVPYFSAWDVVTMGRHSLRPKAIAELARIKRKYDHITRWSDHLISLCATASARDVGGAQASRLIYDGIAPKIGILAEEAYAMTADYLQSNHGMQIAQTPKPATAAPVAQQDG